MKKPSVPKCLGGSQKIFLGCSTRLFSSFLRGASCPKSPRAPPLPATLFMRLTATDVKAEKFDIPNALFRAYFLFPQCDAKLTTVQWTQENTMALDLPKPVSAN